MCEFMLHKFRTMRDPMAPDGHLRSERERLTAVGEFLRRSRLDELPQIWNVVVGDMALIGPRPLLTTDLIGIDPAILRERFAVRPGITGWAQVNGGKQLTPEQKISLDLYYIHNASPALDAKIVIETLRMMLFGERVNSSEIRRAQAIMRIA
jgi:lipopolysaccharide/colanic/teichoic acid biosynthesis glycosyltransferase